MLHVVVILVLVCSQVLTIGNQELYLCICNSGFICLETDPTACTCCSDPCEPQLDDDDGGCCCSCEREHQPESLMSTAEIADDGNCMHLLLSNGQSRPIGSGNDHDQTLSRFNWLFCLPELSFDVARLVEQEFDAVALEEPPSYALLSLSCVVLLC